VVKEKGRWKRAGKVIRRGIVRSLLLLRPLSDFGCRGVSSGRASQWLVGNEVVAQCMDARVGVSFELPCIECATYLLVSVDGEQLTHLLADVCEIAYLSPF